MLISPGGLTGRAQWVYINKAQRGEAIFGNTRYGAHRTLELHKSEAIQRFEKFLDDSENKSEDPLDVSFIARF